MTTTQRIVEIGIDARKAEAGAKQAETAFNRTSKATKQARDEQGRFVAQTKKTSAATKSLALGLGALGGSFVAFTALRRSVGIVASFEETIVSVGQVARASGDELAALRAEARELGGTTRFTATQAGEGLLFLSRAGFSVNESLSAIGSTLDLATAGNLALGDAADIASNVLSQFGLAAGETTRVVDDLVNVSNNANTSVGQLAEALKFAGPVAGALGRDVEETAAALGVLGNSGIQASLAGTNLRGILSTLLEPTGKGKKALEELGIAISDLDPNTRSIVEIFQKLEERNLSAAQAVALFGRRNAAAALILRDNVDEIEKLIEAQEDGRGAAEDFSEALNDTLGGSFRSLASAIESVILNVGDFEDGALKSLVDGLTESVRFISRMTDSTGEFSTEVDIARDAVQGLAIALVAGVGAQALLSVTTYTAAIGGLTKAFTALSVAVKANPIFFGVSFGVFAISQLIAINERLVRQRSLLDDLRKKEVDLAVLRSSFEGASGPLNLAARSDSEEVINRAFDQVDALIQRGRETLAQDNAIDGRVTVSELIGLVPDAFRDDLQDTFRELEEAALAERDATISRLEGRIASSETRVDNILSGGTGGVRGRNVDPDIMSIRREASAARRDIRELNNTPLDELQVSARDAAAFFETLADTSRGTREEFLENANTQRDLTLALEETSEATIKARDGFAEFLADIQVARSEVGLTNEEIERQRMLIEARTLANEAFGENSVRAELAYGVAVQQVTDLLREREEAEKRARGEAAIQGADDVITRLQFQEQALRDFSRSASDNQIIISGSSAIIEEFGADSEEAAGKIKELEAAVDGLENARRLRAIAEGIGQAFSDAFSDVIFEAESVEDAIEGLVRNTAKLIFDQLVAQQIASFVARIAGAGFGAGGGFGGGFKHGGVIDRGSVIPFASGGIVDRPTKFPMSGGRTGLMGEAGPEAIVPLPNSRAIPVEMKGGGGTTVINQTVNVETPDAGSFDRSKNQIGRNLRRQLQRSV
ncbi:MAG: phage tail tape measure protein [Planctomycetaceae bacterium]|nr:phage tail tape measure protein [Planctomycetaceae bacterium]